MGRVLASAPSKVHGGLFRIYKAGDEYIHCIEKQVIDISLSGEHVIKTVRSNCVIFNNEQDARDDFNARKPYM